MATKNIVPNDNGEGGIGVTGKRWNTGFINTITGNLTGDVTGNVSGTAATVTGAAQSNITSLGTLTGLNVTGAATFNDSVTLNGSRYLVQRSNDDSAIAFANNASGTPSSHVWAVGLNYSNSNAFTIAYGSSGIPSLESSKLVIENDGTIRVKTGSIVVDTSGKGIFLGGTATANNLNAYEEGTWTATMSNDGVGNTATGTYTRIGNLVHVQVWFNGKSITSAGNCRVTGLPYSATASTTVGYGIMNYVHGTAINASNGGYIVTNFFDIVEDGGTGFMTWNTGSSKDAMFAGTYNIN